MEAAFSLEHISIGFNGIPVLQNVDFTLQQNEVHAIVGKNGAGKSTLMKILSGVYKPDNGKITILGKEMTGEAAGALKQGVSMVYQDLSLIPSMTVVQNIFLNQHPFRLGGGSRGLLDDRKARKAVGEIFASMGGIDFIPPDALVSDLSVGEAQLVEIAKSLALRPRIVIFDEPTAALSEIETARLFKTIEVLKERGLSIVYITHYLKDVMRICGSVTVLRDGQVTLSKATAETSIAEIVQQMLGAEQQLFRRDKSLSAARLQVGEPLLEVCEAETRAVGPVSLRAWPGEIIGLAGLLGSGRSEIFRLLYGLDPLLRGQIKLCGGQVRLRDSGQALRHGISLVPEERRTQGLVPDFSIMHNLSLSILKKLRHWLLLRGAQESSLARQCLNNLQIKARDIYQAVRFLSGGNQQKVVFGKCLLNEPRILLLDDPTFGVDVHAKSEIMKLIEEFASKGNKGNKGNLVLFVSSELGEISQFCDRIYIVKKKKIVEEVRSLNEESLLQKVQ